MNQLIIGTLLMAITTLASISAKANAPKDEAAITTIIESVATLADTKNFEDLEKLYEDEVTVDYSSLNGGELELLSAQALMTQWAAVLPGFDLTRHQLSEIKVSVEGDVALASAMVRADHYLGEFFWQVSGSYHYTLKRNQNSWRISNHTFKLKAEKGTRDVFTYAMANAKENPVPYLLRLQTQSAVKRFLTSLEQKDMQTFATLWAEDAVQDMPYAPDGFPKRVSGANNIIKHYSGWPENAGKADFTSELVFYSMQNPKMVFVEFKGNVDIVTTGRTYLQQYGGLFHVEDGKITLFREYFNPEPFKYAFGLSEGASFSK
jgi:ketosteroid isomerase-like protein